MDIPSLTCSEALEYDFGFEQILKGRRNRSARSLLGWRECGDCFAGEPQRFWSLRHLQGFAYLFFPLLKNMLGKNMYFFGGLLSKFKSESYI